MPWFDKPVPVRRNNIRRTQVAPAPTQVPDPPGFRERLRRIRSGLIRIPERVMRELREHRRRRAAAEQQTRCVLQGGNKI
jgi:hypothetical protein